MHRGNPILHRPCGQGSGNARGAAFRNNNAIGACAFRSANDGAKIVWVFDAVEQQDKRVRATFARQNIIHIVVLLFRRDRDNALMIGGAS